MSAQTNGPAAAKMRKSRSRPRGFVWKNDEEEAKLLQIYSRGLEFSLVSDHYEQCHRWVLCKDFLHDVVYSVVRDMPTDIFKFRYDPGVDPKCSLGELRILIGHRRDGGFMGRIPSMLDFMHQIEGELGIKKCCVVECGDFPEDFRGVVMVRASRRWLRSPPMLSLFGLLVRVGMGHQEGQGYRTTIRTYAERKATPYQPKDGKWLKIIGPALHKILRYGDRKVFPGDLDQNYPEMDMEVVHNRLGIVGFAYDMNLAKIGRRVPVPAWHALR